MAKNETAGFIAIIQHAGGQETWPFRRWRDLAAYMETGPADELQQVLIRHNTEGLPDPVYASAPASN